LAFSLTCRKQLTHFHLHPHFFLADNKTGREEMGFLYLILGFFDGVSSSPSLEMSSVRSIKSLLTPKVGLMAADDSSVGSFLAVRAVEVAFGEILKTGFLEWLARLKGEGVFKLLTLFLTGL
jgi:hypothetical protein